MRVDFKSIFKNGYTRILFTILIGYIILLIVYILSYYHLRIEAFRDSEDAKLTSIANTTSTQIIYEELEYLIKNHAHKDFITTNSQDSIYKKYHSLLNHIKTVNNLKTDIYTIHLDSTKNQFFFGLSSAPTPHYFHTYKSYPEGYSMYYQQGGHFGPYIDKHGSWLSSTAPIKDKTGQVISIVQVDIPFDEFIQNARESTFKQLAYLTIFLVVLGFIIINAIIKFLKEEEQQQQEIIKQHTIVARKNQLITSSINYAQRIQEALLPSQQVISKDFPESFVLYLPKDIVSGDFYFYSKPKDDSIYFAAADCTGHGVPGAMMSMMSNSLLNEKIASNQFKSPGEILDAVNQGLKKAFRSDTKTKDGMDIALCEVNKTTMTLSYAGAYRPLIIIRDNQITEYKATRKSIGHNSSDQRSSSFENHTIEIQKGDSIYLYSDGFVDQFGEATNKKFMSKRLKNKLLEMNNLDMKQQQEELRTSFNSWKGNTTQIDDVLVFGIKIT